MKNFDQFEKLVNINESEVSVNINESSEAMALVKKFDTPTHPKLPFKRDLTEPEIKSMHNQFPMFSWSKVDV